MAVWISLVLQLAALSQVARAAAYEWADPTTGGVWETASDWVNNSGYPNALTDVAVFPQPTNSGNTAHAAAVSVTGGKQLESLLLFGPDRVNQTRTAYTISGDALTFADGGSLSHGAFTTWSVCHQTVNNNIVMGGDLSVSHDTPSANQVNFNLKGTISGSGTLSISGSGNAGRLYLTGNNSSTFTGPCAITDCRVMLSSHYGSLGDTTAGTTMFEGAIVEGWTAEPFTIDGDAAFNAYGGGRTYSGPVTVNAGATLTLYPGGNSMTVSGGITGEGAVTVGVRGAGGQVTMSNSNTFAGRLTVNLSNTTAGGWLRLNGSLAHGDIVVTNGARVAGSGGGLISFTDGDTVMVSGTATIDSELDVENIQFDLTGLSSAYAVLVDYSSNGTFTIGALGDLQNVLTAASQAARWTLIDTGTTIVATRRRTIFSFK